MLNLEITWWSLFLSPVRKHYTSSVWYHESLFKIVFVSIILGQFSNANSCVIKPSGFDCKHLTKCILISILPHKVFSPNSNHNIFERGLSIRKWFVLKLAQQNFKDMLLRCVSNIREKLLEFTK